MSANIFSLADLILTFRRLQGDTVRGKVSLTCDAWQASNTDRYFAVTGHWIEEPRPGIWELRSAVLGFTQLNHAHNGQRLGGGALFKIVNRLGIAHKVCHLIQIMSVAVSDSFDRSGTLPATTLQTMIR
jgi:hypothetical protein